jgi:branched-chain amino acid transport system ATP-binding protein
MSTLPPTARQIGDVLLGVEEISLSFGGVKALSGVTFDVRQGEIRAIIGPNGAGKSSMLNVINGVYSPQQGTIRFRGEARRGMNPQRAAAQGVARTFQNIALFKGMTVLDNIMTGRNLKMRATLLEQAIYLGRNQREELQHRAKVEEIIDFLQIEHIRKTPVGRLPYGLQKRVELARALASEPILLLLDEPMAGMKRRREAGHVPLHTRRERGVRHDHRADRTRHGRGDGYLRPHRRAGLWAQDRGWLSG